MPEPLAEPPTGHYLGSCESCGAEFRSEMHVSLVLPPSQACAQCRIDTCSECLQACGICDKPLCRDHAKLCAGCSETTCSGCLTKNRCRYCHDDETARLNAIAAGTSASAEMLHGVMICCFLAAAGCATGAFIGYAGGL
jgi:hypothetical protein